MVSFNDMIRSRFLENFQGIDLTQMIIALLLSLVLGLLIFFVYKKCYQGVLYSPSFGISLVALAMITTLIILAVSTNVILSLGMVGALSIVRFRAAIKDPMDLVYLFWAIAVGIVLAANALHLAIIASIIIAVVLIILSSIGKVDDPYMLVLSFSDEEAEKRATSFVSKRVKKIRVKSKTITPGAIELNFEVRLNGSDTSFIGELASIEGVRNVALVSYGGDYLNT